MVGPILFISRDELCLHFVNQAAFLILERDKERRLESGRNFKFKFKLLKKELRLGFRIFKFLNRLLYRAHHYVCGFGVFIMLEPVSVFYA